MFWLSTVLFESFFFRYYLNLSVQAIFYFSLEFVQCTSLIFTPNPDTHTHINLLFSSAAHIPITSFLTCKFCWNFFFCPDYYFFTFPCSASPSQSQLEVMVWVSALNNALVLSFGSACRILLYTMQSLPFSLVLLLL